VKTHSALFLAWQDPNSRSWFPIGRLTFDGANYQFAYTQGVLEAQQKCDFEPLLSFPRFGEVYTSTYLFPVFANRLMPKNRPDYSSFIHWLNLSQHGSDPITMLARSGGQRETDTLTVFPIPEPDSDGRYRFHFFSHGLRHLPPYAIERINRLESGEKLWLAQEFQNSYDSKALILNTEDQQIVGYCPRYLNSEIFELLLRNHSCVEVRVELVNQPPTPFQFRLLCNITVQGSNDFRLFSSYEYQSLIDEGATALTLN
jgi:HIRAN domain